MVVSSTIKIVVFLVTQKNICFYHFTFTCALFSFQGTKVIQMNLGFSSSQRCTWYAQDEKSLNSLNLVGSSGLEPPTSRLSGVRSNHLSYEPIWFGVSLFPFTTLLLSQESWWRWTGSNRWPPACKAGALPAELHPQISPEDGNHWQCHWLTLVGIFSAISSENAR